MGKTSAARRNVVQLRVSSWTQMEATETHFGPNCWKKEDK